jgi:hypothetical protein
MARTQAWRSKPDAGRDPAGMVLWIILGVLIVLGALQLFLMEGLGSHHSRFSAEFLLPLTRLPAPACLGGA